MENNYTTTQAAAYLGISTARVRKLIRDGRLPSKKQGRDYVLHFGDVTEFARHGRKNIGRPKQKNPDDEMVTDRKGAYAPAPPKKSEIGQGELYTGDALEILPKLARNSAQVVIADPPYFKVLDEAWDNKWRSEDDYLNFTMQWVGACKNILRSDGLLYIFGQLGKREHVWLHACSLLSKEMQFHDMLIWDRAVGYNDRQDSFTPQYEMILVLRKSAGAKPYFNKDAVRIPYQKETVRTYLRDKRYKNKEAREQHLLKGKYATNILRVPSLKGSSKEKAGHPSQKPIALINHIVRSSSKAGDLILDPFLGSGTTAESAQQNGRRWIGIEQNKAYVEIAKRRIGVTNAQKSFSFG